MSKKSKAAGKRGMNTTDTPRKAINPAQSRVVPPKTSVRRGNR